MIGDQNWNQLELKVQHVALNQSGEFTDGKDKKERGRIGKNFTKYVLWEGKMVGSDNTRLEIIVGKEQRLCKIRFQHDTPEHCDVAAPVEFCNARSSRTGVQRDVAGYVRTCNLYERIRCASCTTTAWRLIGAAFLESSVIVLLAHLWDIIWKVNFC